MKDFPSHKRTVASYGRLNVDSCHPCNAVQIVIHCECYETYYSKRTVSMRRAHIPILIIAFICTFVISDKTEHLLNAVNETHVANETKSSVNVTTTTVKPKTKGASFTTLAVAMIPLTAALLL
ncbi:unnamed protein product [Cylicocyclus nassatus]|uniref:Uncharacterized protein n=1 Tax=Cylicocyclus nassatus TaxID=53992 RepID=A0AA36H1I4_CYLNA|nr:unnamed protein product [Cylicocyclus nassatus]